MPQDVVDHAGICNKGGDAHAAAAGAQKRIRFDRKQNVRDALDDIGTAIPQ
jgi:hypothetical protein